MRAIFKFTLMFKNKASGFSTLFYHRKTLTSETSYPFRNILGTMDLNCDTENLYLCQKNLAVGYRRL